MSPSTNQVVQDIGLMPNKEGHEASVSSSTEDQEQHTPLHPKHNKSDLPPSRGVKKWLLDLVSARNNGTKRRLIAVSLLAVLVAAYLRFSKRYRRRITASSALDLSLDKLWPVGLLIGWWKGPEYKRSPQESTMSLLWTAAKEGIIQQALIGSSSIFFQTKQRQDGNASLRWNRAVLPPNNESIKSGILEALTDGGCTQISAIPESFWSKMAAPILAALPFVYLALLYRMMKNQFGGEDISSKVAGRQENDRTTFSDVAGLDPVVVDLREVVSYLTNPSQYRAMGARPPRGVLLHGPPGSGKTLLARAVAGEAMCDSFMAVSGSAFVEMYVGRGAARVRSLFAKARRDALQSRKLKRATSWWSNILGFQSASTSAALQRPACSIVFIDELDAVAKARSSDSIHGNDEREQTLNQLLTEMDGFESKDRGEQDDDVTLIVIAASNRVDVIDEAVLRRFDRQIMVGHPDAEGRKKILKIHAKKIQCSSSIDWDELASAECTENFSGAELRTIVNDAALFAVREKSSVVEYSHLMNAARRISQRKNRTPKAPPPLPVFFTSIE